MFAYVPKLLETDNMRNDFKEYLDYMRSSCYYINDLDEPDYNIWVDNGLIREKGFSSAEDKIYNKQPFVVIRKNRTLV